MRMILSAFISVNLRPIFGGGLPNMSFFDEEGQGLLEYALVLILVAVVVIAIITLLGPEISERLCQYIELFCTI